MLTRIFLVVIALLCAPAAIADEAGKSAYDFSFRSIEGDPLPLSKFAGKAILVVNTASFCGFTPQYTDLQAVWDQYRDRGLVVLGVPSNDFGSQEPGSAEEIKTFCEVNFAINFPLTEKIHVRGDAAHPFYVWAGETLGAKAKPVWNFHKYLIGTDGRLVGWFPTQVEPTSKDVMLAIEEQLARVEHKKSGS